MDTNFEKAYDEVRSLVDTFKTNEQHYLSNDYQEAEVRKDFIDKFFIALGWDVNHDEQKNPYHQEVKIEKTQSNQKRPDYAFYLDPDYKDPVLFVEAKKSASDLDNPDYYFQTIKYGWNANTPIALLTDFEELHILDCRYKPNLKHIFNASHKEYHYSQFTDKEIFSEIYYLFSREAVSGNSLEEYAKSLGKPSGKAIQNELFKLETKPIDEDFLLYIDSLRETLAKAFKKNDIELNSGELTEAVQRTIDRLVFIRFLEDKQIEPDYYIDKFGDSGSSWKDFISVCRRFDAKYNGVVFKKHFIDGQNFSGPELSEFSEICNDICHLNSPYDFDKIPVHILGSIYERFLGKIVHATDQRVKIEEKPEVRKAGGVYYTPKYIMDYIVKNTVGQLIEGKTPLEISKLRIADIACGSGSFLIGAYEYLLDYHKRYYHNNPDKAKKDGCLENDGNYVLSIKQKQKILLNNIYGVDIDPQAVEVTELSLYLKMLEDESTATANDMQVLFHEKILPDLKNSIICANSLIGTDILTEGLFSGDKERKLNPMDFKTAFPEVFKNGGFDAIVGNPPFIQLSADPGLDEDVKKYLLQIYKSSMGRLNTFGFFIARAINIIKSDCLVGYIVPNTIQDYYSDLRKNILDTCLINSIVTFDKLPFKDAIVENVILILKKNNTENIRIENNVNLIHYGNISFITKKSILQKSFISSPHYSFNINLEPKKEVLKKKFEENSIQLGSLFEINQAIALKNDRSKWISKTKVNTNYKPLLVGGKNINRYELIWDGTYLNYDLKGIHSCKRQDIFLTNEKIYFRRVANKLIATIDTEKFYGLHTLVVMNLKQGNNEYNIRYFLGILNSALFSFYYRIAFASNKTVFSEVGARQVQLLHVPKINFQIQNEKSEHDKMVQLVDQMLNVKKILQDTKTDRDKDYYERRCKELDNQIDRLVYELYGLTEEEIKIVEDKE